jgi:dipeptidyl aminopeptidase/acylaminoacyl peptidase
MTEGVAVSTSLIPQDLLFGGSQTSALTVSPDGTLLAYVAPVDQVANVFVRPVAGGEARQLTHDTGRGIRTYRWAEDGQHLVYEQDTGGDENWQIHAVDVAGGQARPLLARPGVRARILGTDPALPDVLCVTSNERDARFDDVLHVSVSSGQADVVATNDGFSRWALGAGLQPLAAVRPRTEGGADVLLRDGESWRTLLALGAEDSFHATFDVFPMAVSADQGTVFLVSALDGDTAQLLALDTSSGSVTPVAGSPRGEVTWQALWHPTTRLPQLVGVAEQRHRYVVVDPSLKADLEVLRSTCDGDVAVTSRDRADELWTVECTRDMGSTTFYLYRRSTRTTEPLLSADPELDRHRLAAMEPSSFRARDGLEIPVYLHFPPGDGRSALPTVVLVHGGPANRWYWGFQPMAQLLANRGYLVVQVDFRGSLGYGKKHFRAGDRQWARAMHTDIVDAVEWVAEQGWADRDRTGLWGTSYGGYEVLVSATHDPDLVACGIAVVAPTNLVTLMASIPPYWQAEREYFLQALGDDEDEWWDRSPLRLADRVKMPLLLFYGEKDPRVPVAEAEQLATAFDQAGVSYEMHVVPDEGHSLGASMAPEKRRDYVQRIEDFFALHLGGRASSTAD